MSFPQDPDHGRRPKRINAFLGLFDAPPRRDWLVWWTVAWTVLAGIAIATPSDDTPPSSLPTWLNALLAALVFGVLFGIFPAYLRLLIRRWRYRRARRASEPPGTDGHSGAGAGMTAPLPSTAPPSRPRDVFPAPPEASTRRSDLVGDQPQEAGRSESALRQPEGMRPIKPIAAASPIPAEGAAPAGRGSAAIVKGPANPSPIDALDLSKVRHSAVLSQARSAMPYPVARAARAIQGATTLRDVYDAVLRGAEALSVVLGVVTTSWAREYGVSTPQLDDLSKAMLAGGVSQGHWIQALASIDRPMAQHAHALPGMVGALRRGKSGSGLIADLKELVQERNRWAHGASPRNELEASERLQLIFPVFERALEKARFLGDIPWILTTDSRYRRREGDFLIHASQAMGDHPDFEQTTFVSPRPLAEDVFYLKVQDDFVDMTPLVVMRPCPTCHQREVSYADRLDEREGVSLKTFDRGHVLFDRSLVDELLTVAHSEQQGRESDTA